MSTTISELMAILTEEARGRFWKQLLCTIVAEGALE